jgi:hypothetical protein
MVGPVVVNFTFGPASKCRMTMPKLVLGSATGLEATLDVLLAIAGHH